MRSVSYTPPSLTSSTVKLVFTYWSKEGAITQWSGTHTPADNILVPAVAADEAEE